MILKLFGARYHTKGTRYASNVLSSDLLNAKGRSKRAKDLEKVIFFRSLANLTFNLNWYTIGCS